MAVVHPSIRQPSSNGWKYTTSKPDRRSLCCQAAVVGGASKTIVRQTRTSAADPLCSAFGAQDAPALRGGSRSTQYADRLTSMLSNSAVFSDVIRRLAIAGKPPIEVCLSAVR